MLTTPNLSVSRVDFESDWDILFATYWHAWKHTLQAVGQLTFNYLGGGNPNETASFNQTKREYLANAKANTYQIWLKVEDPAREHQGLPRILGGFAYTLSRAIKTTHMRIRVNNGTLKSGFRDTTTNRVPSDTAWFRSSIPRCGAGDPR